MVDKIALYVSRLRSYLAGRLPAPEVESVVSEAEAHLLDLKEEHGCGCEAVARFGSPRSYARHLLRSREIKPNPWRVSLVPLSVVFAFITWISYLPPAALEQWIRRSGPLGEQAIVDLEATVLVILIIGLYRARQVLWGPICLFMVLLSAGETIRRSAIAIPVNVPGTSMRAIERSKGLVLFERQIGKEIVELEGKRTLLHQGMAVFAGASVTLPVPKALQPDPSYYTSPANIIALLVADEKSEDWHINSNPFLFFESYDVLGGVSGSIDGAVEDWRREGPAAIERVNREISLKREQIAAAPAAFRSPWWKVAWATLPGVARGFVQLAVLLFEWNIILYVAGLLVRRMVLPRRRYAR